MNELTIELDRLTKHQIKLLYVSVLRILKETKSFSDVEELSAIASHINSYDHDLNELD